MSLLLWFDDKVKEREATVRELAANLGLSVVVARPDDSQDSWPEIVTRVVGDDVALILVDHCLADTRDPRRGPFDVGSALCMAIRERWRCVPVIGISAASKEDIPSEDREEYTDFISLGDIQGKAILGKIRAMVGGFSLLRTEGMSLAGGRLEALLKCPATDGALLRRIVPCAIMEGRMADNGHSLYKWFRDVLFKYQGILVDGRMVAASIGVTYQFFCDNVAKMLEDCEYRGLFAGLGGPRYWRAATFARLADIVKDEGQIPVSHYVDRLKKSDADMAVCYCCGKHYTELIASEEQSDSCRKYYPVHFRCVEPANLPCPNYFDPIYVPLGGAN